MMKKILFSMATALMLLSVFSSCSNDDSKEGSVEFKEQSYSAWSKVVFAYGTMFDSDETVEVSREQVTFHSDTWGDGTFTISEFKRNTSGAYELVGTGSLTMDGHGSKKDYAATVTGTIAQGSQTFTITVPSVMGGTVLNVTVGEMPLAAAIDGTYKGGTYANSKYFQHYQPTADEKVTIKANEELTAASLGYTSATWGEFTFEDVEMEKNTDGTITLTGEGMTLMPGMQGGSKEYAATLEATVTGKTLVATFAVPGVMGGTTIYFNAADFEEVLAEASQEEK